MLLIRHKEDYEQIGTQVLLAGARATNYYGYDFQGGIIPQIFLPKGTKLYTSLSTFDNGLAVYEPLEKFVMPDLQKRLAYVTGTEITASKDCVLFGSFYTRVTTRKIRITLPNGNYVYPCGGSNSGYYSCSFGGVSIPPLFIPKGCKLYQDSDGYDNDSFLAIYEPLEL